MGDKAKGFIVVAIFLMVLWGIQGAIEGDGFFGGIGNQIDAIGMIVSYVIKIALVLGIIWFLVETFKDKDDKINKLNK